MFHCCISFDWLCIIDIIGDNDIENMFSENNEKGRVKSSFYFYKFLLGIIPYFYGFVNSGSEIYFIFIHSVQRGNEQMNEP